MFTRACRYHVLHASVNTALLFHDPVKNGLSILIFSKMRDNVETPEHKRNLAWTRCKWKKMPRWLKNTRPRQWASFVALYLNPIGSIRGISTNENTRASNILFCLPDLFSQNWSHAIEALKHRDHWPKIIAACKNTGLWDVWQRL